MKLEIKYDYETNAHSVLLDGEAHAGNMHTTISRDGKLEAFTFTSVDALETKTAAKNDLFTHESPNDDDGNDLAANSLNVEEI